MYNPSELKVIKVDTEEIFDDLVEGVVNSDMPCTPFAYEQTEDSLRMAVTTAGVVFFNVYYENIMIGYMFIDYKTGTTAEFHWGVTRYIKYLPPIIRESFEFCKSLGINNFLGTIPVDNKMSKRIAKMMGFKTLTTINNYLDNGNAVYLVQYEVK